jgi:hypothetical protein
MEVDAFRFPSDVPPIIRRSTPYSNPAAAAVPEGRAVATRSSVVDRTPKPAVARATQHAGVEPLDHDGPTLGGESAGWCHGNVGAENRSKRRRPSATRRAPRPPQHRRSLIAEQQRRAFMRWLLRLLNPAVRRPHRRADARLESGGLATALVLVHSRSHGRPEPGAGVLGGAAARVLAGRRGPS